MTPCIKKTAAASQEVSSSEHSPVARSATGDFIKHFPKSKKCEYIHFQKISDVMRDV